MKNYININIYYIPPPLALTVLFINFKFEYTKGFFLLKLRESTPPIPV